MRLHDSWGSMSIHQLHQSWVLETSRMSYALGINKDGRLAHSYWGGRLPYLTDYPEPPSPEGWASFSNAAHLTPEEYPGYGGMSFVEPCLKVTFADGVRSLALQFDSAQTHEGILPELDVHLRDAQYPLLVTLHYRVHPIHDMIERWVTVSNEGDAPIMLERIWSAQWHLPPGETYHLTHLTGRWADEMRLQRAQLGPGLTVVESRRLTTSHHHQPWFAVDRGNADEESGEVWFGVLAWSGNWKMSAEVTDFGSTRINMGINDWDFLWRLDAGQSFSTPSSYAGHTPEGWGGASNILHDFVRDTILPPRQTPRKVLYNSWEATGFAVDEKSQIELATIAASMGVELFVLDDGWFHGRNDDTAGLGDWWPDSDKFPNGLGPLIRQVNNLGMEFGLWIEPEMVNPNSLLYQTHPDWVLHFPTRPRAQARHQLILNLGRADVQEYLIEQIERLLAEYPIAYIKWDMNRNISEPGWPDAPGEPREVWVRSVQGLYHVWDTLRARYPTVTWQSCSGGGGRADFGILRLADLIWASDNTEATARLAIQEGFSWIYPANTIESWVTDANQSHLPLSFRFHVSMCGVLGVGGHITRWSSEQRAEAARWISFYKNIRPIIHDGTMYRLRSPQQHAFSSIQYMSKDASEGVLFAFRTHLPNPTMLPKLYLRGLEPEALYTIEGWEKPRSGLAWMNDGLQIELDNFTSTVRLIRRS